MIKHDGQLATMMVSKISSPAPHCFLNMATSDYKMVTSNFTQVKNVLLCTELVNWCSLTPLGIILLWKKVIFCQEFRFYKGLVSVRQVRAGFPQVCLGLGQKGFDP